MLPLVALVGRPNVGKSTLFNALTHSRDALVVDQPGVTRDRKYGVCRLNERPFMVVDTGGLTGEVEGLAGATALQAEVAIQEADLILFVVDARDGLTAGDNEILRDLRRGGKPAMLVINKTDGVDPQQSLAEFSRTGLQPALAIAAVQNRGIQQLLAAVLEHLPVATDGEFADDYDPKRLRLAIVGRPNVGKSTLVNRLLGEERVIASEVAGTTRDAISVDLERDGRSYRLIDTAGIRRRARVEETIEKFSILKTLQAIESSQLVVVMLDGSEGVTDQDATVLGHVLTSGRGLLVAVNKWDGLSSDQREQCERDLERKLAFVEFAPIVNISAKHGSGLRELFRAIHKVHASTTRELTTSDLTKALEIAYEAFQPPMVNGHAAKLRFAHPAGTNPPTIVIHGTRVTSLTASYKRYLENFFRKRFKLVGTPLRLEFKAAANPFEGKKNVLTEAQQRKRKRLMSHVKKKR
ncbi:MAG: ribosome biogenesis GTPase Der [Pseudomarimonas sp.]